jgi:hypothetical protein
MKKTVLTGFFILLIVGFSVSASAQPLSSYKGFPIVNIILNNQSIQSDVPGINVDGTTLVPLRVVSENLGAKIVWDGSTSTAMISNKPVNSEEDPILKQESKIYKSLQREINSMQNLIQQIQIAKDLYIEDQSTSSILNIKQGKLVEKENKYKELNNQSLDFQQKYAEQTAKVNGLADTVKQYNDLLVNYESAVNELDKYTQESTDQRLLRNYYYFLGQANEQLYQLQSALSLIDE